MKRILILNLLFCFIFNTKASFAPAILVANPVNVSEVAFVNLGTYRGFTDDGSEYQKTYFLTRWIGDVWSGAKAFCTAFNLQLTTLETLEEARAFLKIVDSHPYFKIYTDANFYMDGMTSTLKSTTEWYWTSSENKISFPIPWLPGQPDNGVPNEHCFGFRRSNANQNFGFSDFNCKSFTPHFTCQRIDLFLP